MIGEGRYGVRGLRGNREGGAPVEAVGRLWLCGFAGAESERDGCQLCVSGALLPRLNPTGSVQPWEQT